MDPPPPSFPPESVIELGLMVRPLGTVSEPDLTLWEPATTEPPASVAAAPLAISVLELSTLALSVLKVPPRRSSVEPVRSRSVAHRA